VLLFALALSIVTGVLFGLVPALGASRPRLVPALRTDVDPSASSSRWRPRWFQTRSLLVVVQVALSIALLIAAGLFLRSLQHAQQVDPGFDAEQLLTVPLNVNILRYTTAQGRDFYARAVETATALPGVKAAAVARVGLLPGAGRTVSLDIEGRQGGGTFLSEGTAPAVTQTAVAANVIGPRYFETLNMPIRAGRDFGVDDSATSPLVAIVNESLAVRYLDSPASVPAQRISLRGPMGPWLTIVGVVADAKYATLTEAATPVVYLPLSQNHETGMTLIVRTAGDPASLLAPVRAAIRTLEPNLPITGARSGGDILGANLYTARIGALLLAAFAALALLLAAVGMYGVLAFSIQRRTREMGIRLALGADPRRVFLMIVREGLMLVIIGGTLGLGAALAGGTLVSSFLYGVGSRDVVTFISVPAVLIAVALAACVIPARRAMRVDPVTALRTN
jgi:putative ABC transport system permease protein